jgi:STE24 endopeptidase
MMAAVPMATINSPIADTPEARRYNRIHRRLGIADAVLGLVMLAVILGTGWTTTIRDWAHHLAPSNYVAALFFYVVILSLFGKILGFGFELYGYRIERQYHLSNQRFRGWAWDQIKGYLLGLLLSLVLAELLYVLIRDFPQHWWLIAWAAFTALFIFFAQIAPVVLFPIFYKFRPLENDSLRERLTRLSEKAGTRVRGVYEWKLSEKSNKANAALTGLGATRRIILADTLLQNYSEDEIEAVLAHELGHHVHKHIFKSIIIQAIITFAGFWVVKYAVAVSVAQGWFISKSDFANLPLIILVSAVMSLLLVPFLNAYSRTNERQADRYAWKSIPSIVPFVTAMNRLADQNLAERNPSRWVEILFHSHPPISKRVRAAEAWSAKSTKA